MKGRKGQGATEGGLGLGVVEGAYGEGEGGWGLRDGACNGTVILHHNRTKAQQ